MLKDRALDALKAAAVAQAETAQLRAKLMLRQPAQADVRLHLILCLRWLLTVSMHHGGVLRHGLAASQHASPCLGKISTIRTSCSESSTSRPEEHESSHFRLRHSFCSIGVLFSKQAYAAQAAGLSGSTHIRPGDSRSRLQMAAIQEQLQALEHRLSQQQHEQLGVSVQPRLLISKAVASLTAIYVEFAVLTQICTEAVTSNLETMLTILSSGMKAPDDRDSCLICHMSFKTVLLQEIRVLHIQTLDKCRDQPQSCWYPSMKQGLLMSLRLACQCMVPACADGE